jgi:hypothetical protein
VRRWPVFALAAFAIALVALAVTYYLQAVTPAAPAVLSRGGTFELPAGCAYFIQGAGKAITVSSNVTIAVAYAQMGAAVIVNKLPVNTSHVVGSFYVANVTTPDGRAWYPVVHYGLRLSGTTYNVCFNGSLHPLPNGLYLIVPGPWVPPASAHVSICRVAHSAVNRLFTGDISYDGTYIYVSNVDTGLALYTNYLDTSKASASSTSPLVLKPSVATRTTHSMRYGYLHLIAVPWHVFALVPPSPAEVTVTAEPWP